MKTKKLITAIFILTSINLFAQGPGGRGGRGNGNQQRGEKPSASKILEMLDVNNDKVIDKDEASNDRRGKISEDFAEIDTNEDGVIDLDELEASLESMDKPREVSAEKVLKEIDDNEDGLLNELEVAAKDRRELINNFKIIDTDEDGQLNLEELKTFYSSMKKEKR